MHDRIGQKAVEINSIINKFDSIIGNSIDNTNGYIEQLLINEDKLKELLINRHGNIVRQGETSCTASIKQGCNHVLEFQELQSIVRGLVEILVMQKTNTQNVLQTFEEERVNAKDVQKKLILENEELLKDPLTGLGNTQKLYKDLGIFIESYKNKSDIFSFRIINIDNFVNINEQYGFSGGDIILKYFSKFLIENLGDSQLLYRINGNEFIIIGDSNRLQLSSILNEVLTKLNNTVISNKNRTKLKIKISFSAGIGVVQKQDIDDQIENVYSKLYERAFTKLQVAKNNGKNQIK